MSASNEPLNQVNLLSDLADVLVECGLHEISLEQDGVRLELRAPAPGTVPLTAIPAGQMATVQNLAVDAGETVDESLLAIASPMVGVFYRSPSPSDPAFVEVGDHVEIGQTVGLVEAMKVFNEILSEVEGTVVSIEAENSDLVESGSPLLLVRPVLK